MSVKLIETIVMNCRDQNSWSSEDTSNSAMYDCDEYRGGDF